jgi:hypothetical protein
MEQKKQYRYFDLRGYSEMKECKSKYGCLLECYDV